MWDAPRPPRCPRNGISSGSLGKMPDSTSKRQPAGMTSQVLTSPTSTTRTQSRGGGEVETRNCFFPTPLVVWEQEFPHLLISQPFPNYLFFFNRTLLWCKEPLLNLLPWQVFGQAGSCDLPGTVCSGTWTDIEGGRSSTKQGRDI